MTTFTLHTPASAPVGSRPALSGLERNIGFIPNLAATIAGSPVAIESFVALQTSLRRSGLTGLEREVVGLTVSYANACEYSMAAHSAFAKGQGADEATLAALRAGEELPDARLQALHVFTRELLERRGHAGDEPLAALLDAGYTIENALEVITQLAYTTLANHVANVAATPLEEAFATQAWTGTVG